MVICKERIAAAHSASYPMAASFRFSSCVSDSPNATRIAYNYSALTSTLCIVLL